MTAVCHALAILVGVTTAFVFGLITLEGMHPPIWLALTLFGVHGLSGVIYGLTSR